MLQCVEVVCLVALRLMNNYFSFRVWWLKIIVHDARCKNLCALIVLISISNSYHRLGYQSMYLVVLLSMLYAILVSYEYHLTKPPSKSPDAKLAWH